MGGAHTPYPEPTLPSAVHATLPVYTPTLVPAAMAIIKDMTYDSETTWKSFLVKFTRLARSQQWTNDEQHGHFYLSLDGVASDYYTLLTETSLSLGLKDIFGEL
jgi:hypothetical protein